ncbi:MAG: carbonic anhydrase [Candidatus Nanohaloarchaea archaeon]
MQEGFIELLRSNLEHAKIFQDRFDSVQDSQEPDFVTVCCSDSRVLQDHMWGNEHPGHVFTCSNIGNRVFQDTGSGLEVSGDVLYPVEHTGTETIVVVGHTGCGAVTAAYRDIRDGLEEPEGIDHCISLLEDRLEDGVEKLPEELEENEAVNRLVEYNVDRQVEFLCKSKDIPEEVDVVGVVYDFQDVYSGSRGEVHVINIKGENDSAELKDSHPEIQDRVQRLWSP